MEVIDLIYYLRLIAYDDKAYLKRIINKPRRRFGRTKLAALEELNDREASDVHHGMLEILESHLGDEPFRNSDTVRFVKFIKGMRDKCGDMRITDIVNEVTFESGYESYLRSLGDEERYENLMEFKRVADEFEKSFGENLSLVEFLNQL